MLPSPTTTFRSYLFRVCVFGRKQMTILKSVPRIIPPRLLYTLASMGHGDELVSASMLLFCIIFTMCSTLQSGEELVK